MENKCIVCGSFGTHAQLCGLRVEDGDLLIAADGGYDILTKAGYKPNILIGDLDSIAKTPSDDTEILKFDVRKDDSDTLLAIKYGMSKGYKNFTLYGVIGGRLDHTVASLQALAYINSQNCYGEIRGKEYITLLDSSSLRFDRACKGTISVFSYSEKCIGVTIKGLDYCLDRAELVNKFPIGLSNEFTGEEAEINVENGVLLIICESGKQIKILKNKK